jgi:hypothetical protein
MENGNVSLTKNLKDLVKIIKRKELSSSVLAKKEIKRKKKKYFSVIFSSCFLR